MNSNELLLERYRSAFSGPEIGLAEPIIFAAVRHSAVAFGKVADQTQFPLTTALTRKVGTNPGSKSMVGSSWTPDFKPCINAQIMARPQFS